MWFRCLPFSDQSAPWGLHVSAAGFALVEPEATYPPTGLYPPDYSFSWRLGRSIPDYKIVYIPRGRGEYETSDGNVQSIVPGTVLLIVPGNWHRYRPRPETGWTEYWLVLNGQYLAQLAAAGILAPGRILIGDDFRRGEILTHFQQLTQRMIASETMSSPILAASAVGLLAAIATAARSTPVAAETRRFAGESGQSVVDALNLIHDGLPTQSVDDIVTQLPVSRRTLERSFRDHLGHGIHHAIVHARVSRAQRLLHYEHLSLDEVAVQAGFPDARTMRRAFQSVAGSSPKAYRTGIPVMGPGDGNQPPAETHR